MVALGCNDCSCFAKECGICVKEDERAVLENPSLEWDHPAITIADPGDVNVRTEKWAYISYHTGDEELDDMTADKMQHHNLAASPQYRAVKEKLKKYIPEHTANFIGVEK